MKCSIETWSSPVPPFFCLGAMVDECRLCCGEAGWWLGGGDGGCGREERDETASFRGWAPPGLCDRRRFGVPTGACSPAFWAAPRKQAQPFSAPCFRARCISHIAPELSAFAATMAFLLFQSTTASATYSTWPVEIPSEITNVHSRSRRLVQSAVAFCEPIAPRA
jgi:hypothetical protein